MTSSSSTTTTSKPAPRCRNQHNDKVELAHNDKVELGHHDDLELGTTGKGTTSVVP
jgi:hypothetical protein